MNIQALPVITVHPWPGPLPTPVGGVLAIGMALAEDTPRAVARQQIRRAVQQLLAGLHALPPEAITLDCAPGRAPTVTVPDHARIGISFSHEAGLSVAAIHLHGPVGVDIMCVRPVPDWQAVANDFLGPEVTRRLSMLAPDLRMMALAQAWTELEAGLKCHGEALIEWQLPPSTLPCVQHALALPLGFVGALAVPA